MREEGTKRGGIKGEQRMEKRRMREIPILGLGFLPSYAGISRCFRCEIVQYSHHMIVEERNQ